MAVGDPLSKTYSYGQVQDLAKIRVGGAITNPLLTNQLFLDEVSLSALKVQNILGGLDSRFYGTKNTTLTITGSANPYSVDLTVLGNLPLKVVRVVHVTGAGVRTFVQKLDAGEAQGQSGLTQTFGSSVFYVDEGDSLELWAGSSFTITTATDKIHLYYFRQATVASVTRTTKVDILDVFIPFVIEDVVRKIRSYQTGQEITPDAETAFFEEIKSTWANVIQGKQLDVEERP